MILILFGLVTLWYIIKHIKKFDIKNYCESLQKEINIKKICKYSEYENILKDCTESLPKDITNIILSYASNLTIDINSGWNMSIYSYYEKYTYGTIIRGNLITWNDETILPTALSEENKLHLRIVGKNKELIGSLKTRKIENNKIKTISTNGRVSIMQDGKEYFLSISGDYIETKEKKLDAPHFLYINENINIESVIYYDNKIYASSITNGSIYEIKENNNNNTLELKRQICTINTKDFAYMKKFQIWNQYIFMFTEMRMSSCIYVYDMKTKTLQISKNLFFDNSDKYGITTFDIFEDDIYIKYFPIHKWNMGKYLTMDKNTTIRILVKKCEDFIKLLFPVTNDLNINL